MENVKNLVYCEFCKKLFEQPLVLPCSNTICAKDLFELNINNELSGKNSVYCYFCQKVHDVPKDGFPSNETIKTLIRLNFQDLSFGYKHQEAKQKCIKLETTIRDFENFQRDPKSVINQQFSSLRSKIDLRRENLKNLIDKTSDKLINQVNKLESDCNANVRADFQKPDLDFINELKEKLTEANFELDKFEYNEDKWKRLTNFAEFSFKSIQDKKQKIVNSLFGGRNINFRYDQEFETGEDFFGRLEVEDENTLKSSSHCIVKRYVPKYII